MSPRAMLILAALPLAACAHRRTATLADVPPPVIEPARVVPPPAPAPPAPSPINDHLSPAGAVWHLRAGLNVAALACRGPEADAITAGYNRLLVTQKVALAAAQTSLQAEFKAEGGDWQDRFDDAMTRLYNFFSGSGARDRFCAAAVAVLADADAIPTDGFTRFAVARLPDLDQPFVDKVAPAPVAPPVAIAAVAPVPAPTPKPRLELDLSQLAD